MKSVLLIDDHPVVALGLGLALQGSDLFRLAGTVSEPLAGLDAIETLKPDIVIVDLVFAGTVQLFLIKRCRAASPSSRILVFSSLPAHHYERESIDLGADAFLSKEADMTGLVQTMTELTSAFWSASVSREIAAADEAVKIASSRVIGGVRLTPREVEIAKFLSLGQSASRIASAIGVSANTVAVHRDNIRRKFDCRDTPELISLLARVLDETRV